MSRFDKEYIALCEKILSDGVWAHNRTGNDTIMIPSYNFKFNLQEEFPILTTKQVFIRQAILEMLWIWQVQSNDVRWLRDRNVNIWNEWEVDSDGIYRIYENIGNSDPSRVVPVHNLDGSIRKKRDGSVMMAGSKFKDKTIRDAKFYGKKYAHTIGTAYGYIVKKYRLMDNLLETLKNNPEDRRMVKSLWQDCELETAVLPSCVWSTEWDVTDGYLNMMVHQRSCDVPLGLPFNVTQYATLLKMVAQVSNLKAGTIDYSIKNAHIYKNQIDGIEEQIRRYYELGDFDAPEIWINPEINNFYDFDNSVDCKDVKLLKYKNHGKIKFDITQ